MPLLNRTAKDRRYTRGHRNVLEEKKAPEKPPRPKDKKGDGDQDKKGDGDQDKKGDGDQDKKGDGESSQPMTGPTDAIKSIVKIFPSPQKNEQGYYIADIRVSTEQKKKPFSVMNSLDFELENMLDHISNLSKASQFPVQKEIKDAGGYVDPSKLNMNNYMNHDTTEFLILPTKYSRPSEDKKDKIEGGKKYVRKTIKRNAKRTRKRK